VLTAEAPHCEDNPRRVGIGLWLGSGVVAWILARIIPRGRRRCRAAELAAAIVTALFLGTLATALDFGGWNEPDWRAGTFCVLGAFAAVGAVRLLAAGGKVRIEN